MSSTVLAYLGDNSIPVPAPEAQEKLLGYCPTILVDGERVELAFRDRGGKGRDSFYFTNKRILIRDVQGVTGKKVQYKTVPYGRIKAYSVETAGSIDQDSELDLWTSWSTGFASDSVEIDRRIKFSFQKQHTDIFLLLQYMNEKLADLNSLFKPIEVHDLVEHQTQVGSFASWLSADASQVDAQTVEQHLKAGRSTVLMPNEVVEMAFRVGRDTVLLTSARFLSIDVQGISGKKIKYFSLPWSHVTAFSVTTPGSFLDYDAELALFTDIWDLISVNQDLRKGKVDLLAVQRVLCNKILGLDNHPVSDVDYKQGHVDKGESWKDFFGDNARALDAVEVNTRFHSNPPILQGVEFVEMAFMARRDYFLFTNKRLLIVNTIGFSGKRVEFLSVPWSSIHAFSIESAGSFMDGDTEVELWTGINHPPPPRDEEGRVCGPAPPGMSYLKLEFKKKTVDLMAIKRYLSIRCMRVDFHGGYLPTEVPVAQEFLAAEAPGGMKGFFSMIASDLHQLDPQQADEKLRSYGMLVPDERVLMLFGIGRDSLAFTTFRIINIDVQGFSGKRVSYTSIPYHSVRGFNLESAGKFDLDADMTLFTSSHWNLKKMKIDFKKNKVDINAVHRFLAAQMFGTYNPAVNYFEGGKFEAPGNVSSFIGWMGENAHQMEPKAIEDKLRSDPPVLLENETVLMALKVGRDVDVFTSHRLLKMDVKGIRGKTLEFRTIPWGNISGFSVTTAGTFDFDEEIKIQVNIPGMGSQNTDVKKKKSDLFGAQRLLVGKIVDTPALI